MNPVNNNVNRITDEFRRTWGYRIGCLDISQMKKILNEMEEDLKKQRDYESDKYYRKRLLEFNRPRVSVTIRK